MIALTEEMAAAINNARADLAPVLVATASGSGMPDLAYKGSVMVFDDEHLAWWEWAHGTTLTNVRENGQACLYYRNPKTRQSLKFFGTAEVYDDGSLREQVMARTIEAELERDPERKGAAVVVRVDRVIEAGKEIMRRED